MCKMNGKQLGKAIILVPIFMVLAAILTMSLLAEARPSALNKKPPFNGSIFGKRSGVVSSRGPGLGASNPTLAENYPNWSAFSQQLQQLQQQQEALTLINAAITRCLAQQRDGIQGRQSCRNLMQSPFTWNANQFTRQLLIA